MHACKATTQRKVSTFFLFIHLDPSWHSADYEMQVNDVFLRELLPEQATSSVVLDIGANTGWFSLVAASLGYVVHAVDIQPLCIWHVLTSALENEYDKLIVPHIVGLASAQGSITLSEEVCKVKLRLWPSVDCNHMYEIQLSMQLASLSSYSMLDSEWAVAVPQGGLKLDVKQGVVEEQEYRRY